MALTKSNLLRLYIDVNGTLHPVGHAKDNSMSFSADEIDVSTKETEEGQADYESGTKTTEFSGNGYINEDDDISISNLLTYWKQGAQLDMVFTDNVTGHIKTTFSGKIFNVEHNSAGNTGPVEYSFSGKATGDVTFGTVA